MDIGIFSFNTEYTMPADELARECEARGFESLWLPEHTHMSDPFIGLAAAAAVTKTLKLRTGISFRKRLFHKVNGLSE